MRYAIVVEKAEGNYAAYVPDLPGCIATGATVEEVESLIKEAIAFPKRRVTRRRLANSATHYDLSICRSILKSIASSGFLPIRVNSLNKLE